MKKYIKLEDGISNMSELRRFLRYEIPGLLAMINAFLIYLPLICGQPIIDAIGRLDAQGAGSITIAALAIALPFGWVISQIHSSVEKPHVGTRGFNLVKHHWESTPGRPPQNDAFYMAMIDYILAEDMYCRYKGLADTIRGYWDHYYSRRTVLYSFIVPFLIIFIIFYIKPFVIWVLALPSLLVIILIVLSYLSIIAYSPLHFLTMMYFAIWIYLPMTISFLLSLFIFRRAKRIRDEIASQEFLYINERLIKLEGIGNMNEWPKD